MKIERLIAVMMLAVLMLTGCGQTASQTDNTVVLPQINGEARNVIITESGQIFDADTGEEIILNTPQPSAEAAGQEVAEASPQPSEEPEIAVVQDAEVVVPHPEQSVSHVDTEKLGDDKLNIVFLGDSIIDNHRDETGIAYLTGVACNANVYNMAIAGTSATIEYGEKEGNEDWTSRSLIGVTKAIKGDIPTDIFKGTRAGEIMDNKEVDFSTVDYYVIEYGVNDFLRGINPGDVEDPYDMHTYAGALRIAVGNLRAVSPNAAIVLCSPCYSQFFGKNGAFLGDANMMSNGYGTISDFKGACEYVSNELDTLFMDAYQTLGIDSTNADDYLEDGIHLTQKGRALYDGMLGRIINYNKDNKNSGI